MKTLIALTIVSVLLSGTAFASESVAAKECSSTQSSQARVAGKDVSKLAKLAKDYYEEIKKDKKAEVVVE